MNQTLLARVMDRAKLPSLLLGLRAKGGSPWFSVLTYHRAAHPEANDELDPGTIDVTPEAFDRHVTYMKRWFDIVGMDDFFAFRRGGTLPKNPLLITFDDGYKDNHDTVLPILQKHGVKATFFIATHYLSERRLFWWDKIALYISRSKRASMVLEYPSHRTFSLADDKAKAKTRGHLLRIVKDCYGLDLDRFLAELASAAGVTFTRDEERAMTDKLLMTWDHVRALRSAGMDVQSHTSTHRVLQTIDEATIERELVESRAVLEGVLGEPVRAISYPVGKSLSLSPAIRTAVKKAGYELGFSNASGTNHRWDFDPLDARRLAIDIDDSDAYFHAMLAMPYIVSRVNLAP